MAGKDVSITIHGKVVDDNTRCTHYHSALDIIAIKFKCCGKYYPCYQCHEETAGHAALAWKKMNGIQKLFFAAYVKMN